MKDKFLSVALSQVGYLEKASNKELNSKTANAGDKNYTKYGAWYGLNPAAWCAMFVSWCANEAGILKTLIPRYSGSGTGYKWFKERGQITMKPKSGDIGFLKPTKKGATSSHTFIVYDVFGDTISTIEGNINNRVIKQTRRISDSNILGFGSVLYPIYKYVDNVDYEGLNVRKITLGILRKKVIATLKNGTRVKVYKTKNGWSKVSPDSNAWCCSQYLKKVGK